MNSFYFFFGFGVLALRYVSSASLRASNSPSDTPPNGDNRAEKIDDSALAFSDTTIPAPLTVRLSTSSRHRAHVTKGIGKIYSADGPPSSSLELPLVGIGVGNISHNKIPFVLSSALSSSQADLNFKLIDTSHTPSLEVLVGRSLSRLGNKHLPTGTNNIENSVYHVIIKVRHTHLGYERTMLSIQESLADILPGQNLNQLASYGAGGSGINQNHLNHGFLSAGGANIRIHALLQYPRCYDELFQTQYHYTTQTIFSSCQEEENALDDNVKHAGPSPLLDRDNAWRRSWRAFEELYRHGTLESIGVSNFGPKDMEALYDLATVGPHIYQGSLKTYLSEHAMIEELVKHGVHFQVYDAASSILHGKDRAPKAYTVLELLGARLGGIEEVAGSGYGFSAVQILLGWLVQRGVGVIPGTSDLEHLIENGPASLANMPKFSPRDALDVETAVLALIEGKDVEEEVSNSGNQEGNISSIGGHDNNNHGVGVIEGVVATFFNALRRNIRIFHVHPGTGQQLQVSQSIPPGRSGRIVVNPSDVLIAYDGHGVAVKKFLVDERHGGKVDFSVEL